MKFRIADMTSDQVEIAETLIDEALRKSSHYHGEEAFSDARSAMRTSLGLPSSYAAMMRLLNDKPEPAPISEEKRAANRRAFIEDVLVATGHRHPSPIKNVTPSGG